jgi:hypothetical protein
MDFNKLALIVGHMQCMLGVPFLLYHCNAKRNTEEKLHRPPWKVPFIIGRFQASLQRVQRKRGES